jgi:hypothetical protein
MAIEPPNPPGSKAARRAGRRVALLFLRTPLDLEHAGATADLRRRLARTATLAMRRTLLERPPRGDPPARPSAGQLAVYGPFDGTLNASVALEDRRGGRGLLEFELRRRAGRWRVARIHP